MKILPVLISLIVLASLASIACGEQTGQSADTLLAVPSSGPAPLTVMFTEPPRTEAPLYRFWDFGDGTSSMAQDPVHRYLQPGTYTATFLAVYGSGAQPGMKEITIHVLRPLLPVPPSSDLPLDPDKNGLCEDVNGDGTVNFMDVIDFFVGQEWIAANEPPGCFDFDGDGAVTFSDVIFLFRILPDDGILTPVPTTVPTLPVTTMPTLTPTVTPSSYPTTAPATSPTTRPTTVPTTNPTTIQTTNPTTAPTTVPTTIQTSMPTTAPTTTPTIPHTIIPTTTQTTVPTTSPTVSPSPTATQDPATILGQAILKYTNQERAKRNLPAFTWNSHIAAASLAHSQLEVATGTGGHILSGEPDIGDRLHNNGVTWYSYGENIAFGFRGSDPDQVAAAIVYAWVWDDAGSAWGHRHNILDGITSDPGYNDAPYNSASNPTGYRNFGFNQMGAGAVYGTVSMNGNSYTGWQVTQDMARV